MNTRLTACCHQSCEITASRDMWNCSAALLRIRDPVIIRLLSPVTVEIRTQSHCERILVVAIQTTVIQHCKLLTGTQARSCSRRPRWLSVSLESGVETVVKYHFLLFLKHTSVWYIHLCNTWFTAARLLSEIAAILHKLNISTRCVAASKLRKVCSTENPSFE